MPTASSIVLGALKLLQVKEAGESLSAEEAQDGLNSLNELIDSWTNEQTMQLARKRIQVPFVQGKRTYTIGSGGDINEDWTVSIENAYVRDGTDLNAADWKMEEINSDQYAEIVIKGTQSSYPLYYYHRRSYPLAEINFWPVPGANVDLVMNVRTSLQQFSDINENIDLAPGYAKALRYNLAVDIAPEYRNDIPPLVLQNAIDTMAAIKDVNNTEIPVLQSELVYEPYADYSLSGLGGSGTATTVTTYNETGTAPDTVTETGNSNDTITEGS